MSMVFTKIYARSNGTFLMCRLEFYRSYRLLFVDEKYRHQGLGKFLLEKVEREAKILKAGLAQTDTFDFQANDFI